MELPYTDASLASFPLLMENLIPQAIMNPDEHMAKRSKVTGASGTDRVDPILTDKKLQDRERNRLHARNTRARKKQHVKELQEQLEKLTAEQEATVAKDAAATKAIADRHDTWRHALRKVFDLRAEGSADEEKWLELLAEDFMFTLPITPYRSFSPADIVNNRRVMLGVDGMIADTQSLKVACDSLGVKTRGAEGRVGVEYLLGSDSNRAFFNADGLMCTFMMRTTNAVARGAAMELEKSGMLRVRFNKDDKLEEMDMTFDCIAFYHQIMRAQGKSDFPLVPNTLSEAMKDENSNMVITTLERPFRITHVNSAWTSLCGYELEECKGKNLSILQGPKTDMSTVEELCKLSEKGYPASMVVTNYNKEGKEFRNHLRCYPVMGEETGQVDHIVGVLSAIGEKGAEPIAGDKAPGTRGGSSSTGKRTRGGGQPVTVCPVVQV